MITKRYRPKKCESYLVNITVLEGRHYAWPNMNSFVHLKVEKQHAVTKIRYGTDAPFYNEYFVFEFKKMGLSKLLDNHITITVYRPKACCKLKKILGYITLDIATVWEEEDHQFFRKWAILSSTKSNFSGPMGYLKVTISILTEGQVPSIPIVNPLSDNEIEGNLLLPEGVSERKKALYIFKLYRGFDIIKLKHGTAVIEENTPEIAMEDSERDRLPNVEVQITFAGISSKSTMKKRTSYPIWNESLTISELYPPLSQRIKFELIYKHKKTRRVHVKKYINLHSLCSYKTKGFFPTFGPAYLHFYKTCAMGEEYVGKILIAMETRVFSDAQTKTRCAFHDEIAPVFDVQLWEFENILLFATISNVSVVDKRYIKEPISFELNWGRMQIFKNKETNEDIVPHVVTPKYKPFTANNEFWYINFNGIIPCMHIINEYPTVRRRMYKANQIDTLVTKMAERLKEIKNLFKSDVFVSNSNKIGELLQDYFDYVSSSCTKFIELSEITEKQLYQTRLDIDKNQHVIEEFEDIIDNCKTAYISRLKKKSYKTAEKFYFRIQKLLDYPQECWPNIYIWMKNGNRKTECLRFEPREIIFSEILEEKGKYCGQLGNFYFMTTKYSKYLSPVVCKVELYLWLGLESQMQECFKSIPDGFKIPEISQPIVENEPEPQNIQEVEEVNKVEDAKEMPDDQISPDEELQIVENTSDNPKINDKILNVNNEMVNKHLNVIPKYLKLDDYIIFNGRVHIYQGRFVLAFDYTGLSDFVARAIIHDQSKHTQAKKQTLNPIWDETLTFKNLVCYGTREEIQKKPPPIVLEVNDQDRWSLEYVGFCLIEPIIKFKNETYSPPKFPPKLEWHKIKIDETDAGEVLACAELFEVADEQTDDPLFSDNAPSMSIPDDIRPKLVNYRFELFIWGVRHLKKLRHMPIKAPKIVIECSEYKIETEIASIVHLNFEKTLYIVDMQLPSIPSYIPPIMIKLFECKRFGRCIYAGTHLSFIQEYLYNPITLSEYKSKLKEAVRTSLESLPSKTSAELEEQLEELRKQKKREERKKYIKWRIRLICSASNFRGLGKICCKASWKGFKKTLRFLCCLLLCCGCGRMCKKKKVKKKTDQSPAKYYRQKEAIIDMGEDDLMEVRDWWSKYFNSLGDPYTQIDNEFDKNFRIQIYNSELEHHFGNFEDFLKTNRIFRGKTTGDEYEDEKAQIGALKCKIRVYEWEDNNKFNNLVTPQGRLLKEGFFTELPPNIETPFVVRIYCIRGIKLRPIDKSGTCDSFIIIRMGQQIIDDKRNFVLKSSNPFYGRCFELEGVFPKDNTVTISIYDWDKRTHSDLIGQTKIDIENRFYSRHRAFCGLPFEYTLFGETPWRDSKEPTEILQHLCDVNNLPAPDYKEENKVVIGSKTFIMPPDKTREAEPGIVKKEMLALFVLHKWNEIPVNGFHLVPEHVETRSLFHPDTPGIEQGKLQMWIDIFPVGDTPMPHQVNIRTRTPVSYELRVIIWNTDQVVLNEDDFFGDRKSDIYVKGWLTNPDDAQETDVHYRSLTGEGNFNWRFVFAFDYLPAENMIVESKKQKAAEADRKLPCRLTLQVWDNDIFSKDDFIGSMTLYLNRMPRGAKQARQCNLRSFEGAPRFNLFKIRRTRGWWPFLTKQPINHMKSVVSGKLEAEFELVTLDQASIAPVGMGRNAPQPLPPPKRPSTSFNWIFNPWKTCRFIVWRGLRWKLLICLVVVLGALFLGLFVYSAPGYSVKKLLGA